MSVFSKIPKHFPLEHGAPNAMMFDNARILENSFGEPFRFCGAFNRHANRYEYISEQYMKFEDFHWVLTQATINRSKLLRSDLGSSPIRIELYGKTIFVLDGHHRYLHAKYFKKTNGILCFGHEALIK